MVVPDATELFFSIVFSYMGALEFFFIARNLYHWGFKHHKRMIELADDTNSLNELQEKIKSAINEAKEKEVYGLNAMKDGVLYKDGFRVSPDYIDNDNVINASSSGRQVIGSSRNSIEEKYENETSVEEIQKKEISETSQSIPVDYSSTKNEFDQMPNKLHEEQKEIVEEPFTKKQAEYEMSGNYKEQNKNAAADDKRTNLTQSIKTQFGQITSNEQYTLKSRSPTPERFNLPHQKPDDSSSNETASKEKSVTANQQQSSSHETTSTVPEMHFDEYERPEPDGEDVNEARYSDDYLRSLDGIKYRPLVRDDGTKRRRAFKKRRSSGDSTSSRESRASREEEVKMFTSLEEEEFAAIKRGDTEYTPIRYSSDPNLKVDKHSKRHIRSPIKGSKDSEESRSSLEMLNEEGGNPWGDVKPEHYKEMEFWKREKATSIEEENEENLKDNNEQERKIRNSNSPASEAIAKCASPSPARNIPKLSSFEDATKSQHENAISSLTRNLSYDTETSDQKESENAAEETKNTRNVSTDEVNEDNASLLSPANDPNAYADNTSLNENKKSNEMDENVVHDQRADELMETLNTKLRRSPRQDDMETYEEKFIEEERKASRTPSPGLSEIENRIEDTLDNENMKKEENTSTRLTPTIQIEYAPDSQQNTEVQFFQEGSLEEQEDKDENSGLPEGVSDFYDFNASINPSRSKSRSKSYSRPSSRISRSISPLRYSREISPYQRRSRSQTPSKIDSSAKSISGVSDWYDYNVMLNERAYGIKVEHEREIPKSTTDFIISQLKTMEEIRKESNESKNEIRWSPEGEGGGSNRTISKQRSRTPEIKIDLVKTSNEQSTEAISNSEYSDERKKDDDVNSLSQDFDSKQEESAETNKANVESSSHQTPVNTPDEVPSTPQYPRSFSKEWNDTERLKDEYCQNFKRSTYVGESTDFSDDFEELREQTRHFRRSRSKSRTPTDQDIMNLRIERTARRYRLQDKILAEITKTTLNYQDFAKDVNYEFLEHERRGSDSALLQKSEILIQFQDNQSKNDEDDDDYLEGEEYHHFRRFSLNQEAQIEDYPDDEHVHLYNRSLSDNFTTGKVLEISSDFNKTSEDALDLAEAEDLEDSGSDDERQTVVEVEDEIDEDIWDYEKSDEFNEQSECEEAEREVDKYVNHSAKDWRDEGAVGGDTEWSTTTKRPFEGANIDEMYNEALKYGEEERIEKDYETIIEAMNNEDKVKVDYSREFNDNASIRTEDLIEEILKEDEERYKNLSPRSLSSRRDVRSSSQTFINHERASRESDVEYYVATSKVVHHNTASTRLRSRYGLPPQSVYKDYEFDDTVNVDLNYKPKKEYNWRKNFKLDDDDNEHENGKSENRSMQETTEEHNLEDDENDNYRQYLDPRKCSLGGESITLYSRSLESQERQLEIESQEIVEETNEFTSFKRTQQHFQQNEEYSYQSEMASSFLSENIENIHEEKNSKFILETIEQSDSLSKKKKSKKKSRKGSKISLGDEELSVISNLEALNDKENEQTDSNSKKKLKKKKKVKNDVTSPSENLSPDIKSPEPEQKPKTNELKTVDINSSSQLEAQKLKLNQLNVTQPKSTTAAGNENKFSGESNLTLSSPKIINPTRISPSTIESGAKANSPQPQQHVTNSNVVNVAEGHHQSSSLSDKKLSKSPEPSSSGTANDSEATQNKKKPNLQREESSGVYELIKDSSMYPWF